VRGWGAGGVTPSARRNVPLAGQRAEPAPRTPLPRRAETQESMGEENFVPTTSDKTPAQTLRIMDGVNKNELLKGRAAS
jgi:hypothetical protein